MTNVKMEGKKAVVTFDPTVTDDKKIIEAFNAEGHRYKARKA